MNNNKIIKYKKEAIDIYLNEIAEQQMKIEKEIEKKKVEKINNKLKGF